MSSAYRLRPDYQDDDFDYEDEHVELESDKDEYDDEDEDEEEHKSTAVTFFSYSRADSDFALRLAKDLREAGASVWVDQLDVKLGQRWDSAVESALEECPSMLVILSSSSVVSDNVMDEVAFALENKKTVIPILCSDCKIPFRLRRVQYVDFRLEYEKSLKRLLQALGAPKTS